MRRPSPNSPVKLAIYWEMDWATLSLTVWFYCVMMT